MTWTGSGGDDEQDLGCREWSFDDDVMFIREVKNKMWCAQNVEYLLNLNPWPTVTVSFFSHEREETFEGPGKSGRGRNYRKVSSSSSGARAAGPRFRNFPRDRGRARAFGTRLTRVVFGAAHRPTPRHAQASRFVASRERTRARRTPGRVIGGDPPCRASRRGISRARPFSSRRFRSAIARRDPRAVGDVG